MDNACNHCKYEQVAQGDKPCNQCYGWRSGSYEGLPVGGFFEPKENPYTEGFEKCKFAYTEQLKYILGNSTSYEDLVKAINDLIEESFGTNQRGDVMPD